MKDIYSPLEIDEEWDDYAPTADGAGTALMERSTVGLTDEDASDPEGATATKIAVSSSDVMPVSNVMPGVPGRESRSTGTKETTELDAAYKAAEALIDKPALDAELDTATATNNDTFNISDTNSSPTPDTSGLVKITPGESTPEINTDDAPQEIKPVKINVMGEGTQTEALPEPIDQSSAESTKINDNTEDDDAEAYQGTKITPFITPPSKEEDSDELIDGGAANLDTIKASDESDSDNTDNVDNSESTDDDHKESAEADTSSPDKDNNSYETKADKAKAPTNPDDDDELASIMDGWDRYNKEIAEKLGQLRREIEENISRMRVEKSNQQSESSKLIAELDEGIGNEQAKLAKLQTNLSKLAKDKDN